MDHITAAQALHWFEPEGTREEFERILRSRGAVVAVYNDWETFHGGALSRSYAPLPDSPAYESFLAELRALFNNFAHDGVVRFPFTTRVAWGRPFAGASAR